MSELTKGPTALRAYSRWMSGTVRLAVLMLLLLMPAGPAVGQTDAEIEEVFWESVECESAGQVELYLEIYPTGRYVAEAHECLEGQLGLERAARILVQQGLAAAGHDPGLADGLFGARPGSRTRTALRAWQAAKGLAETGYLTRGQADTLVALGREAKEVQRAAQAEAERAAQEEAARQARLADDTAYAEAQRLDTAMAYKDYLAAYPTGRHATEAREREATRRQEAERMATEAAERERRQRETAEQEQIEAQEWPERTRKLMYAKRMGYVGNEMARYPIDGIPSLEAGACWAKRGRACRVEEMKYAEWASKADRGSFFGNLFIDRKRLAEGGRLLNTMEECWSITCNAIYDE